MDIQHLHSRPPQGIDPGQVEGASGAGGEALPAAGPPGGPVDRLWADLAALLDEPAEDDDTQP